MQVIFANDPDCLASPFLRAVLCAAELLEENLQSWPLLEATSTPVQRAWVHAISEAPTGEVNLEVVVKLLKSLNLQEIGPNTRWNQYLEVIMLSMPRILLERFFKSTLSCSSCGYEHSSYFTVLAGNGAEVSFADAVKCMACKQCHQASFVVKSYPVIMTFCNGAGGKLSSIPATYLDLGADYELLSLIYAPVFEKKPRYILRQWLLDRNSKDANSVMYQFERSDRAVKNISHRSVMAALASTDEPVLSQYGLLTYLMYMCVDTAHPLEKAKYLSVTSSLVQRQGHENSTTGSALTNLTAASGLGMGTGTLGLMYAGGQTQQDAIRPHMDIHASDHFRTVELSNNYGGTMPSSKQSSQLFSEKLIYNTLPTIPGTNTGPYVKNASTTETIMLRLTALEQKVNSQAPQQSLQYISAGAPSRGRTVSIFGLRIELWLLITLAVMAMFLFLSFILACVGVSRSRTTTTTTPL